MSKYFLKIALRNIIRQKGYSFINICGLAVAMASTLLILLWVKDELSWDTFHANADTIYRVEQDQPTAQGLFHVNVTPYPMGPALKEEIPEVVNVSRYAAPGQILMKYENKVFYENVVQCVDPAFLEMFSCFSVYGDIKTALQEPLSLVITEDVSKKYFGDLNPVGKTILINNSHPYTVRAVVQNNPKNTSVRFDILISFELMKTIGFNTDSWRSNEIITWVQLNRDAEAAGLNKKISELRKRHALSQIKDPGKVKDVQFQLMPLTDIRLYGRFGYGESTGAIQSIYVISMMACFILLIACINYVNLSTARSAKRFREIGLRKVVGAQRFDIIRQFYGESLLLTLFALVLALFFIELMLPVFNDVSGKDFTYDMALTPSFLFTGLAVALVTGLLSGTYPAIFLSSFQPVQILKGTFHFSAKGTMLRKTLVVFQFALSVILMIGTIVMFRQLQYMRHKDLGYNKEQLIYLPLNAETKKLYPLLKEELQKEPMVLGVTGTFQTPTNMSANGGGADWDGKDPNFRPMIGFGAVAHHYVETMGMTLVEGRSFSQEFSTDTAKSVLVNEEVAKLMGSESVVGKRFSWGDNRIIIGVVKNFHYKKIQTSIEPMALYLEIKDINYAIVRLKAGNITASLEHIKQIWQQIQPGFPFEYRFFDEEFARMFQSDERMMSLFGYAALFAIMVACLGLFGLASFIAESRTREIGIRKVLGASVSEISFMLSKEFILWVIVANFIAWPCAYYAMQRILDNYAYRTNIGVWIFVLAFAVSLAIALAATGIQTIKAATANPVDALKYE